MAEMIYFDNAATTYPKPSSVLSAMKNALEFYGANPGRGGHDMAFRTAEKIYETRVEAADLFHLPEPECVIFTKNCTEALNTVLWGLAEKGGHFLSSSLEHNAVARPLAAIEREEICTWSTADIGVTEEETIKNFKEGIKENTIAIVCTAASNVFGTRLPLKKLSKLAKEKGLYFIVDAAQGAGILNLDMQSLGIDFLCAAGHKGLYGPMGTGLLLCNNPKLLKPLMQGGTGSQSMLLQQPNIYPDRLESGTLNVPGIIALAEGIRFVKKQGVEALYQKEMRHIIKIYEALSTCPEIQLYEDVTNPCKQFVPLLSFNIKGKHSEEVGTALAEDGIAVRAGLHCAPLAHKFYHTEEQGAVRICPSAFTTEKDVNCLLNSIFKIAKSG